ncbi:helix-turn-helix domain-containing protein [Sphingopyxis fribergensis]
MIEQLVEARRSQSLTQDAVARKLGKPQQYVSRYEVGERRLDIVEFLDAASVLGIDGLAIASAGMKK